MGIPSVLKKSGVTRWPEVPLPGLGTGSDVRHEDAGTDGPGERQARGDRSCFHARQRLKLPEQPLCERGAIRVEVSAVRQRHPRDRQRLGLKADMNAHLSIETADHQSGASEQRERQRNLADHESLLHRGAAEGSQTWPGRPRPLLHGAAEIGAKRGHGGQHGDEQPADE